MGKTSLRKRFMGGQVTPIYQATIGADFSIKSFEIETVLVKLNIWDLGGQPRFKEIRELYYRGTDGVMLIYDLADSKSVEGLSRWLLEVEEYCEKPNIPFVILGNKVDLGNSENEIKGRKFAQKEGKKTPHFVTSAITGINVDLAFFTLASRF